LKCTEETGRRKEALSQIARRISNIQPMIGRKGEFIKQSKNNNSVLRETDELNSIIFKTIDMDKGGDPTIPLDIGHSVLDIGYSIILLVSC
jgi:hypothetical protein